MAESVGCDYGVTNRIEDQVLKNKYGSQKTVQLWKITLKALSRSIEKVYFVVCVCFVQLYKE